MNPEAKWFLLGYLFATAQTIVWMVARIWRQRHG